MTQEEVDRIVAEVQDTPGITLAYITKKWIAIRHRTQVPGDLYYAAHS